MSVQEVQLPELGEGVTEGEMVRWLVQTGDYVEVDQAVAEMMTDKATVEVPTPFSGKIKELKVKKGDRVPVKSTILLLDTVEEPKKKSEIEVQKKGFKNHTTESNQKSDPEGKKEKPVSLDSHEDFLSLNPVHSKEGVGENGGVEKRVLATPHTRRLARELNVDLGKIKGTGLAGRILRGDVLGQVKERKESVFSSLSSKRAPLFTSSPSEKERRIPLQGIRRQISIHMKKSKEHIPHFTLVEEASVSDLIRMRKEIQRKIEEQNVKLTYLPFIVKALVQTLKEHPIFNSSLDEEKDEIIYKNYFNIGLAVSTEEGLVVPNIKDADQKSILQIAGEIRELALKARQSKLSLAELKGGTFTISNMGSVGGLFATPIIYHPEVAILGVYKIKEKVVFKEEEEIEEAFHSSLGKEKKQSQKLRKYGKHHFSVQQYMNFSITCDHRLVDGAIAAQFLNSFVSKIENPSLLLLEMI